MNSYNQSDGLFQNYFDGHSINYSDWEKKEKKINHSELKILILVFIRKMKRIRSTNHHI